ncbi:MAG: Flagellin and related hook-associated protein FlgL [Thermodesulfobacteria bacterium]|nr:flagellin [Thermodesulfobacteriota bacterium]MCU4138259.1 Flagellin and related hook-associated protein FlgL [Thermodesulfobacteriota bacterium]
MAVKINFNEAAAKTHTALIINERFMNKSLLRLSTGYRILSAADDSAGLFIADMLGTVAAALEQGNRNIQTGISALQIAETNAGQIYTKLQEIYVRAQSAANDINDPNARQALQDEINNFIDAIQKIASDTEYNGIKLLDGTFTSKSIHYGARKDQTVSISITSLKVENLGAYMVQGDGNVTSGTGAISSLTGDYIVESGDTFTVYGQDVLGSSTDVLVDAKTIADNINNNSTLQEAGIEASSANSSTANTFTGIVTVSSGTVTDIDLNFFIGSASKGTPTFSVTNLSTTTTLQELVNEINSAASAAGAAVTASAENGKLVLETSDGETIGIEVSVTASGASISYTVNLDQLIEGASAQTFTASGRAYAIKVGSLDIAGVDTFSVNTSGVGALGISSGDATFKNLNVIDVSTNTGAETAILIVTKALQKVDTIRAEIGATMNNLQAIYDAQKSAYDNTKEAESVIRNTDYAKEMSEFTSYQIRMQATIAMLAQANTLPQLVLQLLR